MKVYSSRWLLPVSSPPVQEGAVAVLDGRIVAAGPRPDVLATVGDPEEILDLGNAAVLPGLVNAHTHLELSWIGPAPPPGGDYVTWVRSLLELRSTEDPERVLEAAEQAIRFVYSRGTAAVGDVANGTVVAAPLARSALLGVMFQEIYGFRAADADGLLKDAVARFRSLKRRAAFRKPDGRWQLTLTAHAPHTTSAPLLRGLARRAATAGEPFALHVAESEAEVSLLRDGTGPFPDLLRERGMWDDDYKPPALTPVECVDRLGALSPLTLAVHCIHLQQQDHSMLQQRGVTVVSCPRSNERLGVGQAPVPQLLAEGIPVALGTDSLASAPDLDLFAEMAALRRVHPKLGPAAVLRMATFNGATALGLGDRLGSIEPGKLDRLLVVPLESAEDDPLEVLCSVPAEVHWLESARHEVRNLTG